MGYSDYFTSFTNPAQANSTKPLQNDVSNFDDFANSRSDSLFDIGGINRQFKEFGNKTKNALTTAKNKTADQGLIDARSRMNKTFTDGSMVANTPGNVAPTPPVDPLAGGLDAAQMDIIRNMLTGTSPAEEAIMSSLDPSRAGLMQNFADSGATGSGAMQSMLLNQSAKAGGQIADIRMQNQKGALGAIGNVRTQDRADEQLSILKDDTEFGNLITALSNPNLTPTEIGTITGKMGDKIGIDFSSLPPENARKSYEKYAAETLGYDLNNLTPEQKTILDNTVNNWSQGTLGLDSDFQPAVKVGGDKASFLADPFSETTLSTANDATSKNHVEARDAVAETIVSTGDWKRLKDMSTSDPVYKAVLDKIDPQSLGSVSKTNKGIFSDDLNYYSAYGSEDSDGNVIYDVGETFKDSSGNIFEITGTEENFTDDGSYVMVVRNVVTGEGGIKFDPMDGASKTFVVDADNNNINDFLPGSNKVRNR